MFPSITLLDSWWSKDLFEWIWHSNLRLPDNHIFLGSPIYSFKDDERSVLGREIYSSNFASSLSLAHQISVLVCGQLKFAHVNGRAAFGWSEETKAEHNILWVEISGRDKRFARSSIAVSCSGWGWVGRHEGAVNQNWIRRSLRLIWVNVYNRRQINWH